MGGDADGESPESVDAGSMQSDDTPDFSDKKPLENTENTSGG